MKTAYFASVRTLDELKREYRRLAMLHHPDRGGDTATMQAINAAYADALDRLQRQHNASADADHQRTEAPEEYIRIIGLLLRLDGLDIELCGAWLWIGGETRRHKDALKAAGCRWASKKHLWYWHPSDMAPSRNRSEYTIDRIRQKYGSTAVSGARPGEAEPLPA